MGDDAHEAEERATTLALKWGLDAYGKASVQREILWARQEARAEGAAAATAAERERWVAAVSALRCENEKVHCLCDLCVAQDTLLREIGGEDG